MGSTYLNDIIYDHNLLMAIIAINMTIIGLTSLAETKKIIGIDYGKFLIKKYKVFRGVRIYHLLIIFAVVNVVSLFLMVLPMENFRLTNFILLVISLSFAIYYFFGYILSENKLVKKQIYENEIVGLYIDSDNVNHQEADVLTGMSPGSSTRKRLSSNVINYFNSYNYDSLSAFEEIFGPNSFLYDYSNRRQKYFKRKHNALPYIYRKTNKVIRDISYEFFQLYRYSDIQDKWVLEVLRLFDGDRRYYKGFEELRLYNFTRVIIQLNLFGQSNEIYRYKFLEHLIRYYYDAVRITEEEFNAHRNKEKHLAVEIYTYKQLLYFMFHNENNQRDSGFNNQARMIIRDIILRNEYQGILQKEKLIIIFLETTLYVNTDSVKNLFAETIDEYYQTRNLDNINEEVNIDSIKKFIKRYQGNSLENRVLTVEELFG
jgi:hypothetical protein